MNPKAMLVGLPMPKGRRREARLRMAPGPPGWGLGAGLTTQSHKKENVTETATRLSFTQACAEPSESLETPMNAGGQSREGELSNILGVL